MINIIDNFYSLESIEIEKIIYKNESLKKTTNTNGFLLSIQEQYDFILSKGNDYIVDKDIKKEMLKLLNTTKEVFLEEIKKDENHIEIKKELSKIAKEIKKDEIKNLYENEKYEDFIEKSKVLDSIELGIKKVAEESISKITDNYFYSKIGNLITTLGSQEEEYYFLLDKIKIMIDIEKYEKYDSSRVSILKEHLFKLEVNQTTKIINIIKNKLQQTIPKKEKETLIKKRKELLEYQEIIKNKDYNIIHFKLKFDINKTMLNLRTIDSFKNIFSHFLSYAGVKKIIKGKNIEIVKDVVVKLIGDSIISNIYGLNTDTTFLLDKSFKENLNFQNNLLSNFSRLKHTNNKIETFAVLFLLDEIKHSIINKDLSENYTFKIWENLKKSFESSINIFNKIFEIEIKEKGIKIKNDLDTSFEGFSIVKNLKDVFGDIEEIKKTEDRNQYLNSVVFLLEEFGFQNSMEDYIFLLQKRENIKLYAYNNILFLTEEMNKIIEFLQTKTPISGKDLLNYYSDVKGDLGNGKEIIISGEIKDIFEKIPYSNDDFFFFEGFDVSNIDKDSYYLTDVENKMITKKNLLNIVQNLKNKIEIEKQQVVQKLLQNKDLNQNKDEIENEIENDLSNFIQGKETNGLIVFKFMMKHNIKFNIFFNTESKELSRKEKRMRKNIMKFVLNSGENLNKDNSYFIDELLINNFKKNKKDYGVYHRFIKDFDHLNIELPNQDNILDIENSFGIEENLIDKIDTMVCKEIEEKEQNNLNKIINKIFKNNIKLKIINDDFYNIDEIKNNVELFRGKIKKKIKESISDTFSLKDKISEIKNYLGLGTDYRRLFNKKGEIKNVSKVKELDLKNSLIDFNIAKNTIKTFSSENISTNFIDIFNMHLNIYKYLKKDYLEYKNELLENLLENIECYKNELIKEYYLLIYIGENEINNEFGFKNLTEIEENRKIEIQNKLISLKDIFDELTIQNNTEFDKNKKLILNLSNIEGTKDKYNNSGSYEDLSDINFKAVSIIDQKIHNKQFKGKKSFLSDDEKKHVMKVSFFPYISDVVLNKYSEFNGKDNIYEELIVLKDKLEKKNTIERNHTILDKNGKLISTTSNKNKWDILSNVNLMRFHKGFIVLETIYSLMMNVKSKKDPKMKIIQICSQLLLNNFNENTNLKKSDFISNIKKYSNKEKIDEKIVDSFLEDNENMLNVISSEMSLKKYNKKTNNKNLKF